MPKDKAWDEVRVIGNYGGGGGSKRWQCKHCGEEKGGTATRIKDHLTSIPSKDIGPCLSVPQSVKDAFEPWRLFRLDQMKKKAQDSSHIEGIVSAASQTQAKRMRVEIAPFDNNDDDDDDNDDNDNDDDDDGDDDDDDDNDNNNRDIGTTIATPLVIIPLPHQQGVTNESFVNRGCIASTSHEQRLEKATIEITRLFIQCGIQFDVLRTPQWSSFMRSISSLGFEWEGPSYDDVMREFHREKSRIDKQFERMKETWSKYGCAIVCYGWSDNRKRRVYNILAASCKGTIFLRAIDASTLGTTVTGLYIWEHIHTAIMEVGKENVVQVITDIEPNCIDMGLILEEEFPKISWTPCASHAFDLLVEDLQKIPWIEDIFERAKSIVKFVTKNPKMLSIFRAHSDLELLKPSSRRSAYMLVVLERVVRVHRDLMRAVVSREWCDWNEHALPHSIAFSKSVMDESWFIEAQTLIKSIKPIYTVLRITDMEGSTMGLIYEYIDRIGEALTKNMSLSLNKVQDIQSVLSKNLDWFHKPIHAAAHILHPLWRSNKQYANEELQEGLQEYFEKWADGDVQVLRRLEDELLLFRNESLSFSRPTAKLRECQLQPVSWWEKYGFSAPTLKRLAIRVLSQDCSSGPRERHWSTWALFPAKKRNMLSTAQFERLVYCHCNLRLLENYHASAVPREVNVDNIDIEKVNAIPNIPEEKIDIYTMLYEQMAAPVNHTRSHITRGDIGASTLKPILKTVEASHDIECIDESYEDEDCDDGNNDQDKDEDEDDSDASP